jgi:hypothetical protein
MLLLDQNVCSFQWCTCCPNSMYRKMEKLSTETVLSFNLHFQHTIDRIEITGTPNNAPLERAYNFDL